MTGLLLVCGLRREAATAAGTDVIAIVGGGRRDLLEERLAAVDPAGVLAVVSFGLAGALDPALKPGDVVLPRTVHADGESRPTSSTVVAALEGSLRAAGVAVAACEAIAAVEAPIATPAAKADLRAATRAAAVDMESHAAAAYAARHGLPFVVLRVISDAADRTVPPAAIAAMGACGGIDVGAVVASLLRRPGQIPALIATARDGARAFRVLRCVGGLLRGRLRPDL